MRQSGISQVEVIVVLVVIVALAVVAWRLEVHGEQVGEQRGRLAAAEKDNEELIAAKNELAELQAEVLVREATHQAEQAALDAEGQRKLKEVYGAKDRFVSDVVAGRIRLFPDRDAGRSCNGQASIGAPGPSPGVDHGAGGGQLRGEAEILLFLNSEAARANKVVVKLTACQRELVADRAAVNR